MNDTNNFINKDHCEEYDETFICHKIRQMCSNWLYVNNPEEARKMDLLTYRRKINKIFAMLKASPYLNDIIFPMFDGVKTQNEFNESNMFEKIQTQVFKFLNILNKKVELEKDFK